MVQDGAMCLHLRWQKCLQGKRFGCCVCTCWVAGWLGYEAVCAAMLATAPAAVVSLAMRQFVRPCWPLLMQQLCHWL
jgi:hypothetical protein